MMGPVWDSDLVFLLSKGYARFFGRTPDSDIARLREVIQLLTRAITLVLLLSPSLDKDEVHYRVPSVVNADEE